MRAYIKRNVALPPLLHFGCGGRRVHGWLNCDVQKSDIDIDLACGRLPFQDQIFDHIVSQHCIEHLDLESELQPLLLTLFNCLKPNGQIWLSCPDINKICRDYMETEGVGMIKDRLSRFPDYSTKGYSSAFMINDLFHQGGAHKNLFDFSLLKITLEKAGFSNTLEINEEIFLEQFPEFPKRNDDFQSLYITSFRL
jgi:predicted SAM-dependent methyltransferase